MTGTGAPAAVWLDADGVITSVNAAWESACLTRGGDLDSCGAGVSYLDLCDAAGDGPSRSVGEAIRGFSRGDLLSPRSVLAPCHHEGRQAWFDLTVYPRSDDAGTPVGAVVVATPSVSTADLGEAGARAIDGEWLWRVLERAPDGIVVVAPDQRILYANRQAQELSGYPGTTLLGMPVTVLVPEALRRRHGEHQDRFQHLPRTRMMRGGTELSLQRADGTLLTVEIALAPTLMGSSNVTVAMIRDVTTSRAVERSRGELLQILDLDPDAVFIADASSGQIEYASKGAQDQLGYSEQRLCQMTIADLTPAGPTAGERLGRQGGGGSVAEAPLLEMVERRHQDGRLLPFDSLTQVVRTRIADREVDKLLIVDRDARQRMELLARSLTRARLSALVSQVSTSVLSDAPPAEVTDLLVDGAAHLVDSDNVSLLIWDRNRSEFRSVAAVGVAARLHSDGDVPLNQPMLRGWADRGGAFALEGPPAGMPDRIGSLLGPGLVTPFPGPVGQRGLLVAFRNKGRPVFDSAQIDAMSELAQQVATAVELGQAMADRARLAMLEQRQRIAADLHDLVAQDVIAMGLLLEAGAGRELSALEQGERDDWLLDQLESIVAQLRRVVFEAEDRPCSGLLQTAISVLVAQSARFLGFSPELVVQGRLEDLPRPVSDALLPVLREALANVGRHASADRVAITLVRGEDRLDLQVADDGLGTTQGGSSIGSGMLNMAGRAEQLGGTCTLQPGPGRRGSTLVWSIPLAAERRRADTEDPITRIG